MTRFSAVLLAAVVSGFFVSGSMAQEVPKFECETVEAMLQRAASVGAPLPNKVIQVPEYPGFSLLVYSDGSGLLVAKDENDCILAKAIPRQPAMKQIMPRLQSW